MKNTIKLLKEIQAAAPPTTTEKVQAAITTLFDKSKNQDLIIMGRNMLALGKVLASSNAKTFNHDLAVVFLKTQDLATYKAVLKKHSSLK